MVNIVGLFCVLVIFQFGSDVTIFVSELLRKIPRETNKEVPMTMKGEQNPDTVKEKKKWEFLGKINVFQ